MLFVAVCLLVTETAAARPPAFVDGAPQFGTARVLRVPPNPACTPDPTPGIWWLCPTDVAGVRMDSFFMVDRHRWTGIMTTGRLSPLEVLVVDAMLTSVWGDGGTSTSGDRVWGNGGTDRVAVFHVEPDGDSYQVRIVLASPAELRRTGAAVP